MKIVIDCRMYSSSGIGKYLEGLLDNINSNDNYFLLIGNIETLEKYKSNNVELLESLSEPFSKELLFGSPVKNINMCDVFYTPYVNIPFGIRIPIVSTIHDLIFYDIPDMDDNFISLFVKKIFINRAVRISQELVTVSEFSRNKIKSIFRTKKTISILYNGFDRESFKAADKSEYVKEHDDYILFIGNLKKNKNLKILLQSFKTVHKKNPDKKLIIVGAGNNLKTKDNELMESIHELKSDNIIFTGFVTDSELKYLLENADSLILPSLYEGFGIPPLEAMISGTNVIISDIEVLREIYSDFPVDFFDPYDAESLSNLILKDKNKINRKEILMLVEEKGYLSRTSLAKLLKILNRVCSIT